jgi:6-phosphogluconolactonase
MNCVKSRVVLSMIIVIAALYFPGCGGGSSQNAYTVGGAVSGLLGTGLVLQNDGGNNLSVAANGSFTFPSRIAGGSTYNITVLTQPSSPAQTCLVINGSGMINSNVTGVGISCANSPRSGLYLFEATSLSSLNLSAIDSSTGALSSPVLAGGPADDSANYPSVVVTPSKQLLYALYTSFTVISGFRVSGPSLVLSGLPNSPFSSSLGHGFNSLALHPTGNFLYVVESPATIEEFSVNAGTGDLTHASAVTEAADFRVAVIDPSGKFLLATDLTGGRIFVYQINQSNGALSAVIGSPFAVPANGQPTRAVLDGKGKFLYAPLLSGGVAALALNSSTGTLTDVPGSPFPTSNEPANITADPAGKFIYICDADGSIDGFAIDATSGALTTVMASPFTTATSPSSIIVDPSGKFVYVSIAPDSTIHGFSLDSSTGSLFPLVGSPFPSVPDPQNLFAVDIP